MSNFISDWITGCSWSESSWVFDTCEGDEFDALIFAAGKGSFYIKDQNDPDGIVHEMLYSGWRKCFHWFVWSTAVYHSHRAAHG